MTEDQSLEEDDGKDGPDRVRHDAFPFQDMPRLPLRAQLPQHGTHDRRPRHDEERAHHERQPRVEFED